MKNRIFWLLIGVWGVGSSGTPTQQELWQRVRLSRLCADGWIPLCLEETEQKRVVYYRGLEKAGLGDVGPVAEELFVSVLEAEKKYGLDYRLLTSVAVTESALDQSAVSPKGARGLLQILPETAQHLWPGFIATLEPGDPLLDLDPVLDAYNLRLSVMLGAFYLSQLQRHFEGDQGFALASYNVGPGRLKKALKEGEFIGQGYVQKVRRVLRRFDTNHFITTRS